METDEMEANWQRTTSCKKKTFFIKEGENRKTQGNCKHVRGIRSCRRYWAIRQWKCLRDSHVCQRKEEAIYRIKSDVSRWGCPMNWQHVRAMHSWHRGVKKFWGEKREDVSVNSTSHRVAPNVVAWRLNLAAVSHMICWCTESEKKNLTLKKRLGVCYSLRSIKAWASFPTFLQTLFRRVFASPLLWKKNPVGLTVFDSIKLVRLSSLPNRLSVS